MRKAVLGLVIAAVAAAVYWLAAPLFIDRKVSESLETIIKEAANELMTVSGGNFIGADNFHKAKGAVKLLKIGDKHYLRFEEDFEVTNGPDLFVYFGKAGKYAAEANLGSLKGNIGSQNYEISAGVNPENYDEVWIWCRAFSVPFGSAKLKKT